MKDQLINKGKALLDEQLSAYGLGGAVWRWRRELRRRGQQCG